MKKKKLNLSKLKIQSFVTDLPEEGVNTVKGGGLTDGCNPQVWVTVAACFSGRRVICNQLTATGPCCPIPFDPWDIPNPL